MSDCGVFFHIRNTCRASRRFHIYCHPVAGPDAGHSAAGFLHYAYHLMAYRDTRHSARDAAMFDVEVAGADACQRHPDNGVSAVLQNRLWFVQKL